jgi:peptide/nickel transport system permease protein
MQRYFVTRLLLLLPTMAGITFLVFIAVRFLPGDVIVQLYGESYKSATPEERRQLEEKFKLNQAIPRQYAGWLASVATGDLGTSITTHRSVGSEVKKRLPTTFELGMMGLIVSVLIALPVGVLSAVRQDTVFDLAARSLAIILLSVPSFWIALLAITYGFIWFGWTPPLRFTDFWSDPIANLQLMWVPALILALERDCPAQ